MSNGNSSNPDIGQSGGNNLTNILTSLQQGVTAINNLTNTIKSIFPSSS